MNKHGQREGIGRTVSSQGFIMEGLYKDGEPYGYNRFVFSDGTYYDGEWQYGQRKGDVQSAPAKEEVPDRPPPNSLPSPCTLNDSEDLG